jgi:rod shape-determining protein MreC
MGTPLWTIKNNISSFFENNINLLNSKIYLITENSLLKEKIKSEEMNQVLFNLLKKENDDLKSIVNRNKISQNILLGAILVKPFLSPYDTLIIDVGTLDGVIVGDKVIAEGDIFIGYISEVYENTSKVVLYSSPGQKVKVLIGNNNIEKEATGLGSGNFKVEMPREEDVKEGDSIVIPSIVANIFGIVEKIDYKESDSFQSILFKYQININELKWVEVLLSNKK